MKRYLKWLALAVTAISLNSCGVPGALFRQGDRVVQTVMSAA